jgi:uncharacterized membrane protein
MSLKLKEDPQEWMKFTAASAVSVGALTVLLWKRQIVSQTVLTFAMLLASAVLSICLVRPRWFRRAYRVGMTVSFHIGQVVGKIVLAVFFWLVLTPMSLLLRLCGKDLLAMRRRTESTTYWQPARISDQFDRQF